MRIGMFILCLFFVAACRAPRPAGVVSPRVELRPRHVFELRDTVIVPATRSDTVVPWAQNDSLVVELANARLTLRELYIENDRLVSIGVETREVTIAEVDTVNATYFTNEDSASIHLFVVVGDDTSLIASIGKPPKTIPAGPKVPGSWAELALMGVVLLLGLVALLRKRKK